MVDERRAGRGRVPNSHEFPHSARWPRLTGTATCCAALCLLLAACGQPGVSGKIFLPFPSGKFQAAGNIEILLVKGDVQKTLRDMAGKFHAQLVREARQSTAPRLEARRAEIDAAVAGLAESLHTLGTSGDQCESDAASHAATARQRFDDLFADLRPALARLGIEAESATTARESLRRMLADELELRARQLARGYVENQLQVESSVVLEIGSSASDRLCWALHNRGRLAVTSVTLRISFDGRVLPDHLLRKYWDIPGKLANRALTTRDPYGREVAALPAGSSIEQCIHAQAPDLAPAQRGEAQSFGLPPTGATRRGKWAVVVKDAALSAAQPAVNTGLGSHDGRVKYAAQPLTDVFAPTLRAASKRSAAGKLLARLTQSPQAIDLETSARKLELCRRHLDLATERAAIEASLTALDSGDTNAPAARRAIEVGLSQLESDPARLKALVAQTEASIEKKLVAFHRSQVDGSFSFDNLEPGPYTLVASNKTKMKTWATWIVSIQVDGRVEVELGEKNVREGTRKEVVRQMLSAAEKPRTAAKPKAGAPPATAPSP